MVARWIQNNKERERGQLSPADGLSSDRYVWSIFGVFQVSEELDWSREKHIMEQDWESTDLRCHSVTEVHDGNVFGVRSLVQTQVVFQTVLQLGCKKTENLCQTSINSLHSRNFWILHVRKAISGCLSQKHVAKKTEKRTEYFYNWRGSWLKLNDLLRAMQSLLIFSLKCTMKIDIGFCSEFGEAGKPGIVKEQEYMNWQLYQLLKHGCNFKGPAWYLPCMINCTINTPGL